MAYDGIARGIAGKALAKIKDIAVAGGFTVEVVDALPTTDISTTVIYFLPNTSEEDDNTYDEYMYIDDTWEKIGSTSVSLDDYYTKDEVDDLIDEDLLEIKLPFYGHIATEFSTSINLDESSWDNVISLNTDMSNGDYPNVLVTFYAGDTGLNVEVGTTVYQAVVKPKQYIFEVDNTYVGMFTLDTTVVINDSVQISIIANDLTSADRTVVFRQRAFYFKDEVDDDINTVSQGIINVSANITAINEDISMTAASMKIPRANSLGKIDSGYLAIATDDEFETGTSTTIIPNVAQIKNAIGDIDTVLDVINGEVIE